MIDTTILDGDLVDLAERLRRSEVSPSEAVAAALARIEADGRAFVAVEADRAIAEAKRLSALAPGERGSLAGAPYARKDVYGRAGSALGAGSPLRAQAIAEVTAPVLSRLDEAGGVDLGRLQMAEFALSPTGLNAHTSHPENPWNPAYPPGGSSSGSGIAVARGQVSFALGSDTGGSIRFPSGMCGLTGIKPTNGLVSTDGCFPLAWTLDCMGPLARSARDCALLLPIMAGAGLAADAPGSVLGGDLRGITLAVPEGHYAEGLASEVMENLAATIEVLRGRGAHVIKTASPDMDIVQIMSGIVMAVEAASVLGSYIREHPDQVGPQVHKRVEPGFHFAATSYAEAIHGRPALAAEWIKMVMDGADAAILPLLPSTVPTTASTLEQASEATGMLTRFTRNLNYLGLPSVSIPTGFDANGLPMAVQLVGRPLTDMALLGIAEGFQRDTTFHCRRP
ncbi:MAG TPA: amidase [Devosiaceae bacterium]|nr:amidase [Devosiaceae bacterium]